jgi:D-serine deaminase-like pyridoxal phosphate-dependent protein
VVRAGGNGRIGSNRPGQDLCTTWQHFLRQSTLNRTGSRRRSGNHQVLICREPKYNQPPLPNLTTSLALSERKLMPDPAPPTPAIVIDAATTRRNIDRMARYAAAHDLKLRPHSKTHKSLRLAQLQLQAGATGMTVAKPGEAQIMAQVADDILMAYPAVQPHRCAVLAEIARDKTVRVAIDSPEAAKALSHAAATAQSTIGILIDLDVGMGRTGVQSPADALTLARFAEPLPGLRIDGIMYYPGQIKKPPETKTTELAQIEATLAEAIDKFKQAGLCTDIVSGGSTPLAMASHLIAGTTEIRPGTYVYYDMNCVRGGYATLDDCAARIHCTVVSTAVPNQIVIDAGSKTLTSDRCGPAPDSGYGYVVEIPEATIRILSEEHGQVDVSRCDYRPQVGDRLTVIPNHICPCVNLQDQVWWQDDDAAPIAIPVEGRGKVY